MEDPVSATPTPVQVYYGQMIAITGSHKADYPNDHGRMSIRHYVVPGDPNFADDWYAVFDAETKDNRWMICLPDGSIPSPSSPTSVQFGDTFTLGQLRWDDAGNPQQFYLSDRDYNRVPDGRRRIGAASAAESWEQWTITPADPANPLDGNNVCFDSGFVLQSVTFKDYLSRSAEPNTNVLLASASVGSTEKWVVGSPIVSDGKMLRYGNMISVIAQTAVGLVPQYAHMSAPGTLYDIPVNFDQTGPADSNRWAIQNLSDPNATTGVHFGDTIFLQSSSYTDPMNPAPLYLSYRKDYPSGTGFQVGVAPAAYYWEQWQILDPVFAGSVAQIRFGDSFVLKGLAGTGGYLSRTAGVTGTGVTSAPATPGETEIWQAGNAVTPLDGAVPAMNPFDLSSTNGAAALELGDDLAKLITVQAVELLPEVGEVAGAVLDIMWPDSGTDIWSLIEVRVKELVNDMLEDQQVTDFSTTMSGLNQTMRSFNATQDLNAKAISLISILNQLGPYSTTALALPKPAISLPYLVAFATMHLTLLHERFVNYLVYFPLAPEADIQTNRNDLKTYLATYTQALSTWRAAALEWRKGLISDPWTWNYDDGDGLEGRVMDTFICSGGGVHMDHLDTTNKIADYQQHVADAFASQLDAHALPSLLWPYLDPDSDSVPTRQTAILVTGPFGGLGDAQGGDGGPGADTLHPDGLFWNEPGGEFTEIGFHSGEFIYMMQINGGVEHGSNPLPVTAYVDLGSNGAGRRIVAANGMDGWSINILTLTDNKGSSLTQGYAQSGNTWSAILPADTNPFLASLSGNCGSLLDQLYLNWQYTRWQ